MRSVTRAATAAFLWILFTGLSFALPPCDPGYICPCSSPIIIDVDGTWFSLTDAINGVSFDISGTGKPLQIAWTAPGSRNAWLALDRNGNGTIDNGQELFGNYTPQPECDQPNGFLALAEYDNAQNGGNGDGVINEQDAIYHSLRLWIDANHNGISEIDELHTLPELGVVSLSLDYTTLLKRDHYGNTYRYRARVNVGVPNSTVGEFAYDVFLSTKPPAHSPLSNQQQVIDGAVRPDAIPQDVVYSFFLRRASCADDAPELQKLKCRLVQKSVGLAADDEQHIAPHVAGIRESLLALDVEVAKARKATDPDAKTRLTALENQRNNLVENTVAALKRDLSPDGRILFDGYIERMKRKIRFIPAPTQGVNNAN